MKRSIADKHMLTNTKLLSIKKRKISFRGGIVEIAKSLLKMSKDQYF